jgi:hypothetical protein
MKKFNYILILVLFALTSASIAAPRGVIQTKAVTPNTLTQYTTNSISNGLTTIAKGTYSYLAPFNFGDTSTISSVVWSFTSKPTGSNASLTNLANKWATFLADTNGTYVVNLHMVTLTGSHDTSITITASYYVGVGNFEGVAAIWPQCMSCHSNYPEFVSIFNTWKVTPHAKIFQEQLVLAPPAGHYSTSCTPCHTTGTDNHVITNNGGFDDVAKQLGWTFASTTGQWDTIKNKYPGLVNFATIGCENCHGAGKEHGSTGLVSKIAISLDAGLCQSCHDAPWRHAKGTLWNASMHSTAIWESGFAKNVTSTTYTLNDCIKCHDGQAFISFTKGMPIDGSKFTAANHTVISCATCHDPHVDVPGTFHLRNEPISSDTLGNKFNYAGMGGTGKICMNCHKARRDNVSYTASGTVTSTWGPHHNPQADNFFGQNAAQFGTQAYISNGHKDAITDACATCHMASSTTTDTLYKYQVGGHSTNMHYSGLTSIGTTVDYDHTLGCQTCHGTSKTKFSDWQASMDYDGNGVIEDIQTEVQGCLNKLYHLLPLNADTTINYANINTTNLRKAYWNYQLIANDGSFGMHNAKFAFDVLTKTIAALGSPLPVELVAFTAIVTNNKVNLTWQTATETNNKGFDVEKLSGTTWAKTGFVAGKGTTTEVNNYSFTDQVTGTGKISYRLKQYDFGGKVSYSKVIEVSYNGPSAYSLSQNYPNPFNPSTTIKFALPFDSNVKLTVFNVTGQVVKVLANGLLSAGDHNIIFSFNEAGTNLSSGIYFYTLEASATSSNSTFRETKKMVLMK